MKPGGIESQVKEVKIQQECCFQEAGPAASLTFELGRGMSLMDLGCREKGRHTIRAVVGCIISQYCVIFE